MKYYFKHETLDNLVSTLSIVSSDKDAKILVIFGEKSTEKDICNVATCLGGTEQINMKFVCEKPEGFEGPETYAFDAKLFLSLVQSCLALKERIYIETSTGVCYVGVDDKAHLPMMAISLDAVPDGIPMDSNKILVQCSVKATDFMTALRSGAYAATGSDQLANAVFIMRDSQVFIYSSDGKTIARGTCACSTPEKNEVLEQRVKAYMDEKNIEVFTIALPKKVVSDMQKIGTQVEQFNMVITDRHIFMAPNISTIYAASLGAQYFQLEKLTEEWINKEKYAEFVVDSAELKASLDLLLKFMDASGGGKSPILMTVKNNEVLLEQTEGNGGSTRLKVVEASTTEEVTYCFDGKKVMETLNSLLKGNLKLSFVKEANTPVMFSNGSLDQQLLNGHASFVLPIKRRAVEEDVASANTDASEDDTVKNGESK